MSTNELMMKKVKVTDILYEVQTRKNVFGHFTPNDQFVNVKRETVTKDQLKEDANRKMEDGWKWLTNEWQNGGSDSWQYASKWTAKASHWSYAEGIFDVVKRRKWWRSRVKVIPDQEYNQLLAQSQTPDASFTVELMNDDTPIHGEVDTLKKQLEQKYLEITANTHKPNILLLGGSGAGKSSLVNAVFGKPLAEIGEGKPITQQYTKFSASDSSVVIYDSKGIEHGYVETGFIADTKKFFKKLRSEPELEKHIHVVWYVIDLTQARFQPFEATFCREYLKDIPIIFVLNKADAVSPQVRDIMIGVIKDHNLPNAIAIYPTIANCKNFDSKTCPQCNSPKIRKRLKAGTCTIMCKECGYNQTLEKTSGIDQLSRTTLSVMPDLVKEVYILSQKSHVLEQETEAKRIITLSASDASMTRYDRLREQLIAMVQKLVTLYKMPTILALIEKVVTERYDVFFNEQRFTKKAAIFLNDLFSGKKNNVGQAFMVAAGLEVCNNVVNFKNAAIQHSIRNFESQVQKEVEQEAAAATQSDTDQPEPQVTTTVISDEQKRREKEDKEWFIHKLVANMQLNLDSNLVLEIAEEIRKFGAVHAYLKMIPLDGVRQYRTPDWEEIKRRKREQEEEDRKAMAIPLYSYQKSANGEDQQQQSSSNGSELPQQQQEQQQEVSTSSQIAATSSTQNS